MYEKELVVNNYQSYQSGIETQVMALEFRGKMDYQSYQSGIETRNNFAARWWLYSINRTKVELKRTINSIV